MRITVAVAKVLAVFLADVTAGRYGLELMDQTGLASGTLYPLLQRLLTAGWVEASWEEDELGSGRPARRYYRLTAHGVQEARQALAQMRAEISGAPVSGEVNPAW